MCAFESEQMKKEKEGYEQAVLGRRAEVTWLLPRERDSLAEEGVFGDSHAAGARADCEINCQLYQT